MSPSIHHIEDLTDNRLEPYRHLRTRDLTRFSQRFIAESRLVVQRLVASDYGIESVLIEERFLEGALEWLRPDVQVLVAPAPWIEELVGFHFHRGFLACGIRRTFPSAVEILKEGKDRADWTGLMAMGIQDPENLGVILRTCAGLGIRDCILGPGTADPLSRRVLRVSMGSSLKLNLLDTDDESQVLNHCRHLGIESVATSLQEPAIFLEQYRRKGPTLVLFGNEAHGLPDAIQAAADTRLKIEMKMGTDSFNVSVAAGITLHHICRMA